jgi:hypothetical protein
MSAAWENAVASPGVGAVIGRHGGTLEVLAVRRVRTLVVLLAMVCAVFAGSTSAVSAGGASVSAATGSVPQVTGKRWDRA